MKIDFNEIGITNFKTNLSDEFELFARDFLQKIGYKIIQGPARGADGGKDLVISELLMGLNNQNQVFRWLVSCKHNSISSKSVSVNDEINLLERMKANKCKGFIGFYSTLPSQGLSDRIIQLSENEKIKYQIFDRKNIEELMFVNEEMDVLFQRYFPKSFKNWKDSDEKYESIKLFDYYIKNEGNCDISFLLKFFKTKSNLLRAIRKTNNIDDLFKDINTNILVKSNLEESINRGRIENLIDGEDLFSKGIKIRNFLNQEYKLNIKSNLYCAYIGDNGKELSFLFKECAVMNDIYFNKYIESVYYKIKGFFNLM